MDGAVHHVLTPRGLSLVALAALGALVLWLQPYSAEWPGTGYTRPAQRYVRAALRRDAPGLHRLSASSTAVAWAIGAERRHRQTLEAWAHDAQGYTGTRRGDTTEVFLFNTSARICPESPIVLRFVGSGGRARVVSAVSTCADLPEDELGRAGSVSPP